MACKPFIFLTYNYNYQRSTALDCKDIEIRTSEFVATNKLLHLTKKANKFTTE